MTSDFAVYRSLREFGVPATGVPATGVPATGGASGIGAGQVWVVDGGRRMVLAANRRNSM